MILLNGQPLSIGEVERVAHGMEPVGVHPEARERMKTSRSVVDEILRRGDIVYGVNTGFGRLSDITLPPEKLRQSQLNLIRSHACGVGKPLSFAETRALMLLRANVLATGFSGARPEVLDALVTMIEEGRHPVIPEKGSVGASGDLAPLAHLAVSLAEDIELEAKEGLVLINGTQAMGAVGCLAIGRATRLLEAATLIGACTLEGLLGTPVAFDPRIHAARPHDGQVRVAGQLTHYLAGSQIRESHLQGDTRVQDAYALRCMPQVHGSVWDTLQFARRTLEIETGAATDNPLVFSETGEVLSGGNFHGAPLSHAFDFAAIALTDLMSMSERRTERLVNPDLSEGLPAFLARDAGSSSGLMIPHVVVAALLNEAKVLSHPSSTDNVPTSAGKEDHVSMGMTGALKLRQIVDNLSLVLAIEAIAACEALEYRRPLRSSRTVEGFYAWVRETVAPLTEDRSLTEDIEGLAARLCEFELPFK
ncbi:MAG: aromatic amino acid lyase [Fimbriimonadaceae bacterium]